MSSFTKREQIVILVIVFIIISILGFEFFLRDIIKVDNSQLEVINNDDVIVNETDDNKDDNSNSSDEEGTIIVHISGQVNRPGVVELENGKRVIDAVELAGGLKNDADIDRINLAKKLVDEEKIYVPKIGEEVSIELSESIATTSDQSQSGKVNINTCSKSDLVGLPGIGDVIADRIIEYRSTNKFSTIEDIKNVSGIGEKKFESIKDLITVK